MLRTLRIALVVGAVVATTADAQPHGRSSYGPAGYGGNVGMELYAELDYYGEWIHLATYGWVWRPYEDAGWRPYFRGHWVWSDYGWTWVAYEPYGWAVYHHGYWTFAARYGWLWIPGYEWAPSRVQWVVADGYVCWAPLPPPGYHIGYPWNPVYVDVWITVEARHFTDPDIGRHRVRTVDFKSHYRERSAVRYKAPEVRTIERYEGKRVKKVDVRLDRRTVRGREFRRIELPREQKQIVERHRVKSPRVERRGRDVPRVTERGRTTPRVRDRARSTSRVKERGRSPSRVKERARNTPRVKDRGRGAPRVEDRARSAPRVKDSKREDRRDSKRPAKRSGGESKRNGKSKRGGRGRG